LKQPIKDFKKIQISDTYSRQWWIVPASTKVIATFTDGKSVELVADEDFEENIEEAAHKVIWNFRKNNTNVSGLKTIDNVVSLKIMYATSTDSDDDAVPHYMNRDAFGNTVSLNIKSVATDAKKITTTASPWTGGQHFTIDDGKEASFYIYKIKNDQVYYLRYVAGYTDKRAEIKWTRNQTKATILKTKHAKFDVSGIAAGQYFIEELATGKRNVLDEVAEFTVTAKSWGAPAIELPIEPGPLEVNKPADEVAKNAESSTNIKLGMPAKIAIGAGLLLTALITLVGLKNRLKRVN
jgi:hypothetical protein